MAGGEGTRLRPLTCNLPKPMVPIVNKPMIEHIVELLVSHEIRDILVTLYYLPEEVVSVLGDGSNFGANITYSIETEQLGTAGSVKKLESKLDETFLIVSGDSLTDFDLQEIIFFHRQKKAAATVALARVENPLEFGLVITDPDQRIRRFVEKPGWGEVFSDTVNTGIYVLEPQVFKTMEYGKSYDFSRDLFPILLEKDEPLYGCTAQGYWCDVGNLQQYRQAQVDVLDGRVKVKIPGTRIRHDIWIGEGSVIDPRAEISGPTVIGKNCRIKERANVQEYTLIGDNCIVEEGAVIQRSVLWSNTYVGKKAKVTGSILSRSCTVKGNNLISEGAVIGDKCFLGSGSVVHQQVKIWPEKRIEPGANVSMSLVWGGKWPGSLFSSQGITGLANIEITPEFALKLGAAYGASLEKGCHVITSRDSHPASRMINRAIICGLVSVGVNALDYRFMPTPVSRYSLKSTKAKGGVHVRISPKDPRAFLIEFFDDEGINVDRAFERKIENIFFREDFRRTVMEEVGDIEFPSRAIDAYLDGFYNHIDADVIKKANLKVVIDHGFGNASLVLPHLLGRLGTNTVSLNAYTDPVRGRQTGAIRSKSLTELANIVLTLHADAGLWVDVDGERLVLIDEKGRIVSGYSLLNLFLELVLKANSGGVVVVPVTAPQTVESICHPLGGKVKRVKSSPRSLMQEALSDRKIVIAGDGEGGFIFPKFIPSFDAMYSFAKLLEIRAKTQEPISKVVDRLPTFYMASRSAECSWNDKGRIMRHIIEDAKNGRMELLEGVKLFLDSNRWVLVMPDPAEPILHLVAEAENQDAAAKLVRHYESRIEALKSSDGGQTRREYEIAKGDEFTVKKPEAKKQSAKPSSRINTSFAKGEKEKRTVPPEKAFYFWSDNHFLGFRASDLQEFAKILQDVEANSICYHLSRGDFQNWLSNELDEGELAQSLNKIKVNDNPEYLRSEVLGLVRRRL